MLRAVQDPILVLGLFVSHCAGAEQVVSVLVSHIARECSVEVLGIVLLLLILRGDSV